MRAKGWTRLLTTLAVLLCLFCGAAIIFYKIPGCLDRLDETGVTLGFLGCGVVFLLAVVSLILAACAGKYGVETQYRVALAAAAVCALICSFLLGSLFFVLAALMGRAAMDTAMILPGLAVCR